ncbi:hypothetical protein GUJ93_ZPchr0012g19384 [Zizania palustris]|uniref:Uncharacterized protein n=1 Tax=Zizania palustris TaxID=103762 RepID=A0A8J5WP43_ZIZPA|nr:hypothetical protein GUJ93_ZPchr0012g19384 [Zizania palustris]KAG8093511.1 hypothetical protein GUJ93_ZPchr0012g19384 [Zizania palustris]
MGFDSTLPPTGEGVDNNIIEISRVASSDLLIAEEVEKCVDDVSVQVPLESMEDSKSLGAVCDHENNKGGAADEDLSSGCQTPRESIFDPFAPGPEEVACAPKKKVIRATEAPSRRQLSFESGDYPVKRLSYDFDDCEEDQFLERICKMFIDLIISNQALDTVGMDMIDSSSPGSCETPTSEPLLTGIADTCPDAPLRRSLKVLKLSPSICRKLNFDAVNPSCLFVEEKK